METTVQTIIITQKNTCLTSGSKNITKFSPGNVLIKIAQLKRANTLVLHVTK